MTVFAALTEEHRLFERFLARMERGLKSDEATARREIRNTLLVLLPALDRHEEIERLVFEDPAYASRSGVRSLKALVASQHRQVDALRADLQRVLQTSGQYSLQRLKDLVLLLAGRLRLHFQTEETLVWPQYARLESRSLGRSVGRQTRERVRTLEREMEERWSVISGYLGGVR